ncbi:hypothetical protein [Chondromyces crocatus]|uniref:Caspase family p20 domain-containing protein n=1 Tax=Chondromyces crocatus TaxID=52 RepID=A0A0K1EF72_CHOCO|nr:hypothetical protein [Chondromyces crocatus]AKT39218.1 uncharacterized protein CMC5_033670 [Chondromyces crocatus]
MTAHRLLLPIAVLATATLPALASAQPAARPTDPAATTQPRLTPSPRLAPPLVAPSPARLPSPSPPPPAAAQRSTAAPGPKAAPRLPSTPARSAASPVQAAPERLPSTPARSAASPVQAAPERLPSTPARLPSIPERLPSIAERNAAPSPQAGPQRLPPLAELLPPQPVAADTTDLPAHPEKLDVDPTLTLPARARPATSALATYLPWRALVLGGGPRATMNQVAIEGHVRYFHALLPTSVERRILFADGNRFTPTVQYLDGYRLLYRTPRLPRVDGPTTLQGFDRLWRGFVTDRADDPLLLYFAGHGSPSPQRDLDNNVFDLWGGGILSVRDLAARIEQLPPKAPVVVVMAQCFSGAFANLLFEGGDPDADVVDRDLVGFFAATRDRPASGCTPEINEADYTDFSSYFFSALAGVDRLGRLVDDADYDGDQQVGMHEAFAYALIHQATSDVPVATSDVFLRRFVPQHDRETMATPYSKVLAWARPSERAALKALSDALQLQGEDRLRTAYVTQFGPGSGRINWDDIEGAHRLRFIRLAKTVVLAHTLRENGDPAILERFDRLRAAESRNPLLEVKPNP